MGLGTQVDYATQIKNEPTLVTGVHAGSNAPITTDVQLTAGSNVVLTQAGHAITIAVPGAWVTSVTASAPLASSGGTTPNISAPTMVTTNGTQTITGNKTFSGTVVFSGAVTLPSTTFSDISFDSFTSAKTENYIATETGSNNAIAGALLDVDGHPVPLAAGLKVTIKLAHSLRVGSNTFTFNGVAKAIVNHADTSVALSSPYPSGSIITLGYDGTQWQDLSQVIMGGMVGTLSPDQRPTLGSNQKPFFFWSSDYSLLYVWNGSSWVLVSTAAPGPWNAISLLNSWTDIGSPYVTAHYRQTATGEVFVEAFVTGGGYVDGTTVFTLPAGYVRPDTMMYVVPYLDGTLKFGYMLVDSSGNFKVYGLTGNTWLAISISYWTV
jgi:hypothetical protein